jgi:hypothetical protein
MKYTDLLLPPESALSRFTLKHLLAALFHFGGISFSKIAFTCIRFAHRRERWSFHGNSSPAESAIHISPGPVVISYIPQHSQHSSPPLFCIAPVTIVIIGSN